MKRARTSRWLASVFYALAVTTITPAFASQESGSQSSSPPSLPQVSSNKEPLEASGKGSFTIVGQPDPAEVMKLARAYNSQFDTKKNKWEKWCDKQVLKHPKFWRVMRTRVEPAVSITANIIAAVFSVASFVK